jgi:nucleotidyltransferase substrate binding protein (TIGR01987 family)
MPDRMPNPDTRWRQRFENFKAAFAQLKKGAALARQRPLSELERQGLIKAFEFTHELAWNVLKDFLEAEGIAGIMGSKGASREAFQKGLIEDGETWMEMIKARNLTTHTYDCEVAERIASDVLHRFEPALVELEKKFDGLAKSGT